MTSYGDRRGEDFGGWLLLFALGYVVFHHAGTIFADLGNVGDTRWADWVDLLTPYVVTGAAAGALRSARAGRATWVAFWFAAILYTQGHGIHLAANSVANVAPGEPAHLWDEVVGHYLWYGGFVLIVATLAATLAERRARGGLLAYLLALLVGFTSFTNSVEGRTVVLGFVSAAVFVGWGLVTRHGMGRFLLTAYLASAALLGAFGLWQGGFPEFSQLGWI
jgi:hypothetical protein